MSRERPVYLSDHGDMELICTALAGKFAQPKAQRYILERIIEAMSDGLVVVSPAGEIVLANRSACQILGYAAEELLGKGWAEVFFAEEANEDFNQTVVEAIQSSKPIYNRQVEYQTPAGGAREVLATTSLIREDEQVMGLVVMVKDITELAGLHLRERRLMERSLSLYEEKVESLDRIARSVAHEVRNPVTAIGGLAARLNKVHQADRQTVDYLERILEATGRLEQVVAQVRAYAFTPRPTLSEVEVAGWVKELLRPYMGAAQRQEVSLELEVQGRVGTAYLDPHLLGGALNNILDNALDAMPDGGKLEVGVGADGEAVTITIADNGPGVAEADRPYLFDPFYTTKADRVGMSLAITKRIVNEHQGRLEVGFPPAGGSVFTVSLPTGQKPDQEGARAPQLK